jgi:uncharacterized protein
MLEELFGNAHPIIGVVHLLALPGSARWEGQTESIYQRAEQEAVALATGGVDAIIVENFFDAPFTKGRVDAATVSAFSIAVKRIMALVDVPIGINCLRNDGLSGLAIASTTGAQFIRVNVFTGVMATDQGIIEGIAHELLLYRKLLQAQKKVKIFADILVKHGSPVGIHNDVREHAKDAIIRGQADAIILSGQATGSAADVAEMQAVREVFPHFPMLVGSGCDATNIKSMLSIADGAIVASSLKREGILQNPVDVERVRTLVNTAKS